MLRRVALWLVIMMLTVSVSAVWAATPGVVDVNALNLRRGPGHAYQVISTLPQNASLVILSESGEWRQVMTSNGQIGWVFGQYIVADQAFQAGSHNVVVRASRLNVRQGPGKAYPVVTTLVEGQLTQVTGKIGEWFQVIVGGKTGFIHQEWVTPVIAETPVEESVAPPQSDVTGPPPQSTVTVTVPLARVMADVLNMRGGKGTEFPVVTKLPSGMLVAVLEEGTWSKVMLENGVIGYVLTEYVESVGGQALARIRANMVNERSGPDVAFSVVATHPVGQTLTFNGWDGSWVKVSSNSGTGYILGDLLSFTFTTTPVDFTLPPATGSSLKGFIVAIDPGHGGPDPGAIGTNGLYEKNVNFTMAMKLRALLVDAGAEVIVTRVSDYTLSLDERIGIAHNAGADLFVSIHNNAHPSSAVSGTQTFYGITPGSFDLGYQVHRRLVGIGMADKRLSSANFGVLVRTKIPAILTETAFLSNPNDAALLAQEIFLDHAVRAHFEGIHEWLVTRR